MEHGGSLVVLGREDAEGAFATFVHRGRTTDIAFAIEGDVGIGAHHNGCLLGGGAEGDHLVGRGIDEPFALALACEGVDIDEVGLLWTGLHGERWGVG